MNFRELNNKYDVSNVRWGIVRTACLSDELNSATVVLTNIDEINIVPYDIIELTNESNAYEYWLVANVNKVYLNYDSTIKYEYTIDLMSPTKLLEIPIPSQTITNIGQNRTIGYYIDSVVGRYLTSQATLGGYIKPLESYKSIIKVKTDYSSQTALCKEYVFQTPTLREYLDTLYNQVGSIACVEISRSDIDGMYDLTVKAFNLNPNVGNLYTPYFNRLEFQYNADTYITSLENESNKVINSCDLVEYAKVKTSEVVANNTNVSIFTKQTIYDMINCIVKNFKIEIINCVLIKTENDYYTDSVSTPPTYVSSAYWSVRMNDTDHIPSEHPNDDSQEQIWDNDVLSDGIDIIDYVVVKEIFDSLDTLPFGEFNSKSNIEHYYRNQYKNNSLYFQRGTDRIENLSYFETKFYWVSERPDYPAIEYAIYSATLKWLETNISRYNFSYYDTDEEKTYYYSYYVFPPDDYIKNRYSLGPAKLVDSINFAANWMNMIFEIHYLPYANMRLSIDKSSSLNMIKSMDESANSTTDINNYIDSKLEKLRQMANENLTVMATNTTASTYTPQLKLGFKYNDYVLTKIEWKTSQNSITYKGTLTKNYTNKILNTLINREKRYYSLADVSDTVDRYEVQKARIMLKADNWMTNLFEQSTIHRIFTYTPNYAAFKTYNSSLNEIASGGIPCVTTKNKNLYAYTFEFEDNVSYCTKLSDTSLLNAEGIINGYKMIMNKYVDDNGEAFRMSYLIRQIDSAGISDAANYAFGASGTTIVERTNGVSNLYLNKDNRERIIVTHQIRIETENSVKLGDMDFNAYVRNGGFKNYVTKLKNPQNQVLSTSTYTSNLWRTNLLQGIANVSKIEVYILDQNSNEHLFATLTPPDGTYFDSTQNWYLHAAYYDTID